VLRVTSRRVRAGGADLEREPAAPFDLDELDDLDDFDDVDDRVDLGVAAADRRWPGRVSAGTERRGAARRAWPCSRDGEADRDARRFLDARSTFGARRRIGFDGGVRRLTAPPS